MKTKKYILRSLSTCLIAASLSACVDLEPKAMSFLTPENTFVDKAGLETMLRLCRKQMNFEWFGDAFNSGNCETYSVYEYAWSDLAVMGGPETKEIHMHHVRRLKDLTGEDELELKMMQMRRKSIALCPECYAKTKHAE